MFDALFKPKFYSKCKSCLKLIKTRLEVIRKKRNAVQKFLKKDIADLLMNAIDYNAYGRAEGLLIEQNWSTCYELVAKFVECISNHLRDLCKQGDIPDECKEAIPSLMYAAARFSDLPELRKLRTLFAEKYGNSLERYISTEFVEKWRQDPPSKEMKIQLLHDLAQEFSIEWDCKSLEQKLYSPPVQHEEKPKHDPQEDYGDLKQEKNNDVAVAKVEQKDGRDWHASNGNERDTLSHGRKHKSNASWRLQSSSDDDEITTTDNSSMNGSKARSSSLESVSEDDQVQIPRPFSYKNVPPPYVKGKINEGGRDTKKTSGAVLEKELNHDLHEQVVQRKPIPKSVRRRPLRPQPDSNTVPDSKTGDTAKLDSGGMKSEKAKQHQRRELANEEERVMDGLLMHYSKK